MMEQMMAGQMDEMTVVEMVVMMDALKVGWMAPWKVNLKV
jgi:hypothetical protein